MTPVKFIVMAEVEATQSVLGKRPTYSSDLPLLNHASIATSAINVAVMAIWRSVR